MKKISDYERALDYFMSAPLTEANLAYSTVGRVLKNRVASDKPLPVATSSQGSSKKASKKRGPNKPKPSPSALSQAQEGGKGLARAKFGRQRLNGGG